MVAVPEPRWLNREERGVWMRLQAVLQLLPAALDSQLRHDAQFTHVEYYALAMLSDAPNQQLQMKELAGHTNSSLPRLSRVITGLESEGYVTRIPNCRDARATDVQLTAKGREALILAAPGHVNKVRETIFDPISSEDVATLVRICDAWLDVLDPNQTMSRHPDHLPGHPPHHDQ